MTTREKTHYEPVWDRVQAIADRVLGAGETELSRALRLIEADWRDMDLTRAVATAYGMRIELPRAAIIGAREALRMRVLIDHVRDDTSYVVELGSGWGNNLLNLHVSGGPRVPYFALEPTESGRALTNQLAALEDDLEVTTAPFDFMDPVYDLPRGKHVLVFSSHAIEQVPELPEEALTGLLDVGDAVTAVHFEPIGWQVREGAELGATRDYALRQGYNQNLLALVQRLERDGKIAIDLIEPDIYGHKHKNASTLVIWRSV